MTSSNVILERWQLQEALDWFRKRPALTIDFESAFEHRNVPTKNTLVWLSMAAEGRSVAIPFGHPNGDTLLSKATRRKNKATNKMDYVPAQFTPPPKQLRPSEVFGTLEPIFFGNQIKIGHGFLFDMTSVVKYYGGEIPTHPYHDTIIIQWLLDENLKSKGLKDLSKKYYGADYDKENVGKFIEGHTFKKVARYAYMDAKYTWLLWKKLYPRIAAQGLQRVFDLEEEILGVLIQMGLTGAPVDRERIEELDVTLAEQVVDLETKIYRLADQKFNMNAPAQKSKVLFAPKEEGGQGIKPRQLTDGGKKKRDKGLALSYADYSTKAEVLEEIPGNKLVKEMLNYQEVNRIHTGYVRAYLGTPGDAKHPCLIYDGRLHTDLVQYGTVTGRFSSRTPNIQNIPRPGTPLGNQVRGLFKAPPGYLEVVADYGQIEMVFLAHFCKAGRLRHGIKNGMDPHSATAAALAGLDPVEFMDMVLNEDPKAKDMRQVAKGVNFAVVYGAGAAKVAVMTDKSEAQAKRFLKIHQDQFPEIYEFKRDLIRVCRQRKPPHVKTILGRKRRLPTILSSRDSLRMYAERQAVNSVVQGSAADIIKVAMVRAHRTLPEDMRLILSVHDELVVLSPEDKADQCAGLLKEAMLGAGIQDLCSMPLTSDIKIVERWAEAK